MPSTPSITPDNSCCHTDFNLDYCLDGGDIDIYRGLIEYIKNESNVDLRKIKPEDLVKFYKEILKKGEEQYIPIKSVKKIPVFDCANTRQDSAIIVNATEIFGLKPNRKLQKK